MRPTSYLSSIGDDGRCRQVEELMMLDKSIVREVREIVFERGYVNKGDIVETYRLTEDEYTELQEQILADRSIRKGPRRTGGFALHEEKQRIPEKYSNETPLLRTQWEKQAVGRLTELLTGDALETLLGDLRLAVRNLRKRETQIDSTTKVDLAAASGNHDPAHWCRQDACRSREHT
jgi:hypothetical protein